MSLPHSAADSRRAEQFVRLLVEDNAATEQLLTGLTDKRELDRLGVGLTELARTEARALGPVHRAQANGRQVRLARLRRANRDDLEGMRSYLRRAAEDVLHLRAELIAGHLSR